MILSIEITSYKPSGKWYGSCQITKEFEHMIHISSPEFISIVHKHAACIPDGYVVVSDLKHGEGFHNHLFTVAELTQLYKEIEHDEKSQI